MRRMSLLLLVPTLIGCGTRNVSISGQVLYKSKPLPGGQLTLRPSDPRHNPVVVPIDEHGNYAATVPVGEVQVAVDNRALEPRHPVTPKIPRELPREAKKLLSKPAADASPPPGGSQPARQAGTYVRIDSKYYQVDSSGIKFNVEPGMTQRNIELE